DAHAVETDGAADNIMRLLPEDGEPTAQIAFVMAPALADRPNVRGSLRALTRLYADVVHVLVRNDLEASSLRGLAGKTIYVGERNSGTRIVAEAILRAAGLEYTDYHDSEHYAATYLEKGRKRVGFGKAKDLLAQTSNGGPPLDAAFVVAGRPTVAISEAMTHHERPARLLPIPEEVIETVTTDMDYKRLGLARSTIPARTYSNQPETLDTLEGDTYLVCRADLPADTASRIVEALFDNLPELLRTHTKAEDIKLRRAFWEWLDIDDSGDISSAADSGLITLHPGARRFVDRELDTLHIATGALSGKYYELGLKIRDALKHYGIRSRVLHTDGSWENMDLLDPVGRHPVLGIVQLDAAMAVRSGSTRNVYGVNEIHESICHAIELEPDSELPSPGLQRIATLHAEKLFVLYRRGEGEHDDQRDAVQVLTDLDDMSRVCLGPMGSGTRITGECMLLLAGLKVPDIHLSVSDMVRCLDNDEISVGVFVSYEPSAPLEALLSQPEVFRLLPLGHSLQRKMVDLPAFGKADIDIDGDGGASPVPTIGTTAVLVANEYVENVDTITRAIFDSADFLGLGITRESMVESPGGVGSLPTHPAAKKVYEDLELIVKPQPLLTIQEIYVLLAILVILVAAFEGGLKYKRDRIANRIGREILGISLEPTATDSVGRLAEIQDELHTLVRRRWWRLREIDRRRWRYLHDLVDERAAMAKGNLMRSFVKGARTLARQQDLDVTTRMQCLHTIEKRMWDAFTRGDLDARQMTMLRDVVREASDQIESASEAVLG
ncbi:MAG: TAXI family TRAP transporter solute-binding subunit, partial [Planctomycetota bacterium]